MDTEISMQLFRFPRNIQKRLTYLLPHGIQLLLMLLYLRLEGFHRLDDLAISTFAKRNESQIFMFSLLVCRVG